MIGLTGTRVIIVDDDEEEALPILKAFSEKGIPVVFFNGNVRELPQKNDRLSGVRLAILDMDLFGGGATDKSKAAGLVKRLERILSPGNGPYGVLAWTNHPEMLNDFETYLFADQSIPNPIFTIMLQKAECKNKRGKLDLRIISLKLNDALNQFSPLLFMQAWEGKCFQAATDVTNALSVLATDDAADLKKWREIWKSNFLQLMCAMAKAEAGKNLDANLCIISLYDSLNPLHADRMESNTPKLSNYFSDKSAEILSVSADCGIERRARVNTMLHLAFENLEHFTAGNLYTFPSKKKPKWIPDKHQLLEDLIQKAKTPEQTTDKINDVSNVSIPVVIEASATCDHAQKNIHIARFIFGLIVPVSERKKLNVKAGFIWEFGPLFLEKRVATAGNYYIYFSARHLVTLDLKQATGLKAFARLRGQSFVGLQAWFAHHAARPGIMLLGEE